MCSGRTERPQCDAVAAGRSEAAGGGAGSYWSMLSAAQGWLTGARGPWVRPADYEEGDSDGEGTGPGGVTLSGLVSA